MHAALVEQAKHGDREAFDSLARLSGDVTDATPDEIRAMEVIATIVGGIVEYCGDPEVCSPPEN